MIVAEAEISVWRARSAVNSGSLRDREMGPAGRFGRLCNSTEHCRMLTGEGGLCIIQAFLYPMGCLLPRGLSTMVALIFESRLIISWLLPRQRAVTHLLTQDEPKSREIQVGNARMGNGQT